VAAYAALRAAFERSDDVSAALTHREFRAACESHIEEPNTTALETVIEGYEQAIFAQGIDAADAEAVVAAAETVIQQVQTDN
jgi:ferritin-like metal-binding protein YciE